MDSLFHGPHDSCLIALPDAVVPAKDDGCRATVIVCPGGNYEFLCPHEAMPVAAWLVGHGIRSYVLRYRLLPAHKYEDALSDLRAAVRRVRHMHGGLVGALGFSAGGHLIASQAVEENRGSQTTATLDAQVLVYAAIDGTDWQSSRACGFFATEKCLAGASSLMSKQEALLGGPGFAAPPTLLVASTYDNMCPRESHSDRYAKALSAAGVPHKYMLDDFGDHGFGLDGGWTDQCIEWLKSMGFG